MSSTDSPETRDWFLQRASAAVPFLMEQFDPVVGCFHPTDWDERYNNVLYPVAYLYGTEHPLNEHYQSDNLLQAALAAGDDYVRKQASDGGWRHAPSGGYCLAEWPAYYLTETFALLGEGMEEKQRKRWAAALERYAVGARQRPFSFTAPSNEAWKCLTLLRIGQVLQRQDFCTAARFQMAQLNRLQRPEGYWEEPVNGHGPSPAYHLLHLGAMGLFSQTEPDLRTEPAFARAVTFALRSSFPDGVPIDCLDGRSALCPQAALGAVPALSCCEEGRQRLEALRAHLTALRSNDPRHAFASTWSAFIEPCFLVDAYRHYARETEPLPLPAPPETPVTTRLGNSVVRETSPWVVAVCGETPDTALVIEHQAAAERQSRVSVWHRDWGLIVGGGSQARTSFLSPANFMLSTAWRDILCTFGEVRSQARDEPLDPTVIATAYHAARGASLDWNDLAVELCLQFGHGEARLSVCPDDASTCRVEFQTKLHDADSAFCQLPLLLTHEMRIQVDGGQPQGLVLCRAEWLTRSVTESLVLSRPDCDTSVRLERPRDCKLKFHVPIHPGLGWRRDPHFDPPFALGLLSAEVSRPNGERTVTFTIRLERTPGGDGS